MITERNGALMTSKLSPVYPTCRYHPKSRLTLAINGHESLTSYITTGHSVQHSQYFFIVYMQIIIIIIKNLCISNSASHTKQIICVNNMMKILFLREKLKMRV